MASHETALVVHELSDVLPAKVHLTVPPGFRKKPPIGCMLHRASLRADEIMSGPGFRLTAPLRTLVDAVCGGVGREQIEQAVRTGLNPERLRPALTATFCTRGTHALPAGLPTPPDLWRTAFAAMATEARLSTADHRERFAIVDRFWAKNGLGIG